MISSQSVPPSPSRIMLISFALFATLMAGISMFGYRRYVRPARVHAQLEWVGGGS